MLQVMGPQNPFSVLVVVEGAAQKQKSFLETIKTEF